MASKKNLEILYDSLKRDNYDVPDTYESFERTLTASGSEGVKNRQALYGSLRRDNYDVPETYEQFAGALFAPKPTTADSGAGKPAAPETKHSGAPAATSVAPTPIEEKSTPVQRYTPDGRSDAERLKNLTADYWKETKPTREEYQSTKKAVAGLWSEAEAKLKEDREKNAQREWDSYAAMPGREMRVMATSANRHADRASHMTRFDLEKMAEDAWARSGKELTERRLTQLRTDFPGADEEELRKHAEAQARAVSDRAVWDYAVEKNTPKSELEFFAKTVADANLLTSLEKGLARSKAGTSGDMAAYETAMGQYGKTHRAAQVGGTVLGMVADPTAIASGGVGSATSRVALSIGGKLLARRAATAVGGRVFGATLTGRLVAGGAGAAGNLATFEGLKEAESQWVHGGHINPDTGKNEGYSAGAIAGAAGHGAGMGLIIGPTGVVVGNVADKMVKATESAAGKAALRGGELGLSTLLEGTIFSVPQWINGEGDAVDVWTDNMAMMMGFKAQHAVKSAPRVIAGLRPVKNPTTQAERNQNRMSFAERLSRTMDASPSDIALTADEREELHKAGYGELADLLARDKKAEKSAEAPEVKTVKAERIENPEFDGYTQMELLMQDAGVSQSARAKAYYFLTGRRLEPGTISGYRTTKEEDGRITVEATTAEGEVVTSRTFKSQEEADGEIGKVMRQAELNTVDVGERFAEARGDEAVLDAAVAEISPGADRETVKHIYRAVKAGNKDATESQRQLAELIDGAMERNGGAGDSYRPETIRADVKKETGVDVDAALRKPEAKRSDVEKDAVKTYLERLFPEEARQEAAEPTPEQSEALVRYESGKGTYARYEGGDEAARDEIVELSGRAAEAYGEVEEAFGAESEYYMFHVNRDPWGLLTDPELTAEQQYAVLNYLNAKAALEGAETAANESAERKREEIERSVERRTHKDNGLIIPAVMKVSGRQVYIIKGNVVMFPDGKGIDRQNSSSQIFVLNPESGEYEPSAPEFIERVLDPVEAQSELAEALAAIEQEREDLFGGSRENDVNLQADSTTDDGRDSRPEQNYDEQRPSDSSAVADDAAGGMARDRDKSDIRGYEARVAVESNGDSGYGTRARRESESERLIGIARGQQQYIARQDWEQFGTRRSKPTGESVVYDNHERDGRVYKVKDPYAKAPMKGHVQPEEAIYEHLVHNKYFPETAYRFEGISDDAGDVRIVLSQAFVESADKATDEQIESALAEKGLKREGAYTFGNDEISVTDVTGDNALVGADGRVYFIDPVIDFKKPARQILGYEEAAKEADKTDGAAVEGTALGRVPVDESGEPAFERADKETAWDGLVEMAGGEADAAEIAAAQVRQATDELAALKKKEPKPKAPKLSGSPSAMAKAKREATEQYQSELAQWNAQVEAAQGRIDAWNGIVSVYDARRAAERARQEDERRQRDAELHAEAVARHEEEQRINAEKQAEQARTGAHNVGASVKERWETAPKIAGEADEITLADGSKLRGRYVLTEAGAASASHDASRAYGPTEGFPIDENGQTVNDRDYQRDTDAQRIVQQMADSYDNRAVQTPVVVSRDGVVLSGNNRTMSGDLAARQGTDGAYVEYLREFGRKYGFTPEQVDEMKNPRLVFVPDEALPYDATTFSRFNAQEMKSQSKPEAAVKLGKVVPDEVFAGIAGEIGRYDRLSDYYADEKAVAQALGELMRAGVINEKQMPELRTGTALSAAGKELIENTLIGKAFQETPDAVRRVLSNGTLRQSVVMGLGEIASNRRLADAHYDLSTELANAIDLVARAKEALPDVYREGMPVSPFGRQEGLFADEFGESSVSDATTLLLADILNSGKPSELRKVLGMYNNEAAEAAAGQMDLLSGDVPTKEDILKTVNEHFRNATPKEQQQIVDAAIAERKRRAEAEAERRGREQAGEQIASADERSEEGAGRAGERGVDSVSPRKKEVRHISPLDMPEAEKQQRGEMLQNATAREVKPNQIVATDTQTARQAAEAWWDDNVGEPVLYDTEAGEVEINKNSVESSLAHRYGQRKLDAITSLVDGFENAVYLGTLPDSRERGVVDHYFAYPINYNGERCYVFCRAMEDANKNRLYVHEVFVDGKIKKSDTLQTAASKPHGGIALYRDILANVLESERKGSEDSADVQVTDAEKLSSEPTEAQKAAGNYKKEHRRVDGYNVSIENVKGSVRRGTGADGKPWETVMQNDYGYIRGTEGVDGDHIDVFLSDTPEEGDVFVVDQVNKDGSFDEHKVMYGFPSEEAAREAYLSNYEEGWTGLGAITHVSKEEFKKWIQSSRRKTKPFAEYKSVKAASAGEPAAPETNSDAAQIKTNVGEKIEDFGEKIAGARKDMLRSVAKSVENVTVQSLIELPMSKAFKKPPLKKMVEGGVISDEDAVLAEAIMQGLVFAKKKPVLTRRPSSKREITAWAEETHKGIKLLGEILSGDEQRKATAIAQRREELAEQLRATNAHIAKLREWNPGREFADQESAIDAVEVIRRVLDGVGYRAGDKVNLPLTHVELSSGASSYIVSASGKQGAYWFKRLHDTLDSAIETMTLAAKLARGDMDAELPQRQYGIRGEGAAHTEPTGKYAVTYQGRNAYDLKEAVFDREEKAAEFAKAKNGTVAPQLRRTNEFNGYRLIAVNPLTGNTHEIKGGFGTRAEASAWLEENREEANTAALGAMYGEMGAKGQSRPHFYIGSTYDRRQGQIIYSVVADDKANPWPIVKDFGSRKEAEEWLAANIERLEAERKARKDAERAVVYYNTAGERRGEDYRGGRDATAEMFGEAFGFRGVQFGNWTNDADRQAALNQAYDGLMDLSHALGLTPRALSLDGELGLAFGARGSGNAAAHYEPVEVVINLTKTQGAGALAHEWWHAIDNFLARRAGVPTGYASGRNGIDKMNPTVAAAINELMAAVNRSDYAHRSSLKGEYWGRPTEVMARLFESWVAWRLHGEEKHSPFLATGLNPAAQQIYQKLNYLFYKANELRAAKREQREPQLMSEAEFGKTPESLNGYPYPTEEELAGFAPGIESVFAALAERESTAGSIANERGGRYGKSQATGMSLFDWADKEERQQRKSAEPDEAALAAESANVAIDDYAAVCKEYAEQSARLEEELASAGSDDAVAAAIREQLAAAEEPVVEARERLVDALREYYVRENTPEDAERIARDMAARAQAEVEIRLRKEQILRDILEKGATPTENAEAAESTAKEVKSAGGAISYNAVGHLPDAKAGEFAYVERQFSLSGEFPFTGNEYIKDRGDVAYMFRALEDYSVEHVFAVMVKGGRAKVLHLGMGGPTASYANLGAIRAGYDAFGADKIYLVHNHPSGTLTASVPDTQLMKRLEGAFGDDVEVEGIIIDTTSGRYTTFGGDGRSTQAERPNSGGRTEAEVMRFDKVNRHGAPDEPTVIRSAEDVARFVSAQRLGTGDKVSYIVLSNSHEIIGNFHSDHNELDADGFAEEVASVATKFGGTKVIVYGNVEIKNAAALGQRVARHSLDGVRLLDAVEITNGLNRSAADEGLLREADPEYVAEVREPMMTSRADFDATLRRAVDEKGIVMPGLNEKSVRVVNVPRHNFEGDKPISQARKWAKENIVGEHTLTDSSNAEVVYNISGRAVDKYLSSSAIDKSDNLGAHLSVLVKLPEVISESVEAEVHPDYHKGENGERSAENGYNANKLIHRFYGAVNLDGSTYRVKTTIQESRTPAEGVTPHSFEVTEIELLPEDNSSKLEPTASDYQGQLPHGTAKLLKDVEKSYDPGKKLLEESGDMPTDEEGNRYRLADENDKSDHSDGADESAEVKRARVAELSERLHTPIRVISEPSELSEISEDGKPRYNDRERRAKGWWSARDNEIVVVLPNNVNVADVENTVVHEVVGHKGLRALIGEERFEEFLGEVYEHASNPIRKVIDGKTDEMVNAEAERLRLRKSQARKEAGEDPNSSHYADMAKARVEAEAKREAFRKEATEEYMSDLGGRIGNEGFEKMSREELTLWGKIKAKVQAFLDKFLSGLNIAKSIKLTDKDLAYILYKSWKNLRDKGGSGLRPQHGKGGVFADAEDAIMRRRTGWDNEMLISKKRDRIESLRKSKPIEVTDDMLPYDVDLKDRKSVQKALKETIRGKYINENDRRVIEVSGRGINEVTHHGMTDEAHVKSLFAIPDMLRKSTYIDSRANEKENTEFDVYHYYVCGLKIDGDDYTAKIVVGSKNGLSYYDHRLSHIEKGKLIDSLDAFSNGVAENKIPNADGKGTTLESLLQINAEESMTVGATDGKRRFRDGDVGLEEFVSKMKAEAMKAYPGKLDKRLDFMKAMGYNLSHIRNAMSWQREYDITTVKSVADLAKAMLDNGLLDDLSKSETKRILGTLSGVVGRQDVSGHVQRIMDIMIDNQLRMGANTFGHLLNIRGSRIDARGIEVQGELDPDGQRIAQVVRKATSLNTDDIDERISDALDRMGSSDRAIADEAALEYAGLQVARQYAEEIAGSKAEEKTLRDYIKQAKKEKDAGLMDATAYKQYVASTEEAIRQNKIERAEAYYQLIEQMSGMLGESVERARAWREAEKQRVEEIHHNANSDMEGRPANEHHKDSRVQKLMNNSFVRFALAPLATFDQMLRMFGNKNNRGEGYLWNRYMRGWVDATEKEYTGYRDALKVLDAKAAEVFKGSKDFKVKSWGDLFGADRKLPKASVRFFDGGEMKEHELTQGNLLYIYMADKMSDGRMKLRKMGITEDDIEAIKTQLDPRFIELADWMQEEFLVDKRNEYNEVHKRMFGASMAAIENYFPLKILANARLENVDVADDPHDTALPATSTGSIIKRRRNNLALDVTGANAFSVILDHIQQMERWAAFAEFNRDLNTLLSYKRFRNQVMNMSSAYGGGKELWKNFRNTSSMAAGAYRPPIAALDKAAVNIAKGVTAAKVSFRMFTALKQLLSSPAYLSDSNPVYLAANIANPAGAWKWSMENLPIFEKRWRSRMAGDPRLLKSEMDWKMWRWRMVEIASRVGMSPNAFVDAMTVAIGARSMYQTRLAKYKRLGYDRATADKKAKQDATILFNQTQQSSESAFLSTMQVDRSWLSVLFTVFRNSSMSYTRQLYDAGRNLGRALTPGYKEQTVAFMAKQMERDGIDPTKARKNAEQAYRRGMWRDLVRVGVFGFILQFAWNMGAYMPYILLGDDEEEKKKMLKDASAHAIFGGLEGLTGGDVMSAAGQMWVNGEGNPQYLTKEMPLVSDILSILKKWDKNQVAAMNDIINLMVQSGFGVNPQSLTDAVVAVMDYCGDDARTSRECALLIARVLNCPQSQLDKIYFDEIDATGEEASKMTPAEMAERYAEYKMMREAPLTGWLRGDEERDSVAAKRQKKVLDIAEEKIEGRLATDETKRLMNEYDTVNKERKALGEMKKAGNREAYREGMIELRDNYNLRQHRRVRRYKHDMKELTEQYLRTKDPRERDEIVARMFGTRSKMLEEVHALQ